jgi:predicted RNA binding protein YcfA (HicA-like mRNA interferase family)
MRAPRDLSGRQLARALERLWYRQVRREGSHIRLTTTLNGEHHLTIPDHSSLKVGTLGAILKDVAAHHGMARAELLGRLFG